MLKKFRLAMFKLIDIIVILTMVSASPMSVSAAAMAQDAGPALTADKLEYAPGEVAHITGSGFAAGDYILAANGVEWVPVSVVEAGTFETDSPALDTEGRYELRAYTAGWSGDWAETAIASTSFTVTAPPPPTDIPTEPPTATEPPAEPTQEPTTAPTDTPTSEPTVAPTDTPTLEPFPFLLPFIQSDKADYNPGELVTLYGGNWQGDTQVRIFVNDNVGQTWSRDVIVDVASDGSVVDSFNLPTWFVASYVVSAGGQQTGRVVTTTFTDQPGLTLTKSASPLTYTATGQTITFSYLLKNTGTTVLNGPFTVTDNKVPSVSCPATATLATGASITCTGTYTITAADMALGYAANTATASSSNPDATTSNTDVRIVSFPVDCRTDTNGANDVPGQKDLTQECESPTTTNPLLISWNWDEISMSGGNSADACALFDTDNDGLANYAICASWQGNRVMQAGYPVLYSCADTRSDRCTGSTPLTITHGSACALELSPDDPFPAGDLNPNDTKAFCSINLADVGGANVSTLIDVCSYPSAVPNSDPSDCVLITASKGNLEIIKNVVPDDPNTNWNISWTGPTSYSGTISGDGNTGIQAVDTGSYNITETAGTGTDLSLYDTTWACTVDGSASTSGTGTTITGRSVAKGSVVICTFTNTRTTGSLEIKKDVTPDNPGTNWNFAITGPSSSTCSIAGDGTCGAKTVNTGSYTVTETAGSGTNLGDYGTTYACTINGNPGTSGSGTTISGLTISKSDVVVCTFTNSQSPGTLTVNKVVVPSTDTGKFNLLIDGTAKASDVGDGGTTGAVSVSAGSHTVSESAGTGTDLSNYVTAITGDCDASGNVSVQPNQNKTCTITNTRKGNIVIKKVTDPTGQAGDFTFSGAVSGTIQDGGQLTASNLTPGSYTVTETSLADDFILDAISCDDSNSTGDVATKKASITLDPGETVTCTFTNKKLNPNLVVTKTADAASVTAGDPVGFTITVKNNGQGTANNVTLSDPLPAISGVTWTISPAYAGPGTCSIASGTLTCSFGNLAPDASASIHVSGTTTAASCGTWNNTATAQANNNTEVTGQASIFVDCATIKITKTAANGTVSAGDPISFTITITNENTGTAHDVVVTDTLPANDGLGTWTLSGTNADACSIASGTLTCNFGDIAGNASKTVTLSTTTTAATCGTVSNTASVTTSNDGTGESTATVTVQCPNLSVTKTADAATVNAGDPIGYTITVHNAGPGVAKNVTLTDTLPAGLMWTSTPGSPTCTITGQNLSCSLGDLASGADATVHVAATSSPATCGPLTNTATATPSNGTAATSDEATITVNCADVTVTKTGNGPVSAGDVATFTIKVKVTGSGSLSNVTLNDTLPAGVTWALTPSVTGCSISGSPQTLDCAWPTLDSGTTIEIVVSGTTSQNNCGALDNTATVAAANETNTENNTANASIPVNCATIQLEKTTSTPTVSAGDTIIYTITVTNTGAGTARNVSVTDTLPSNAGLNWTISPAVSGCSISGGALTCNFGDIASGGSKSVTLTSPTTAATCGTVSNTASVTTTNDGSATTPATEITVQCPNLSVSKTPDAATVSAGDTIGFTITVSNAGPGEAKGVMISDALPGGLAWTVDASNTTATGCSVTSGLLTCGPDTLASGTSVTVHVTAVTTAASCQTLTNTATATPTNGAAATSQLTAVIVQCPDVTVTKEGNGPISAGDTATFTIHVKNIGLGEAKNVILNDTLPAGVTWALTPDVPECSITGGELSCSWTTLTSGADIAIIVSGTTAAANCGLLDNEVTVTAGNEANTSNNSAEASIQVDCATIEISKTTSTPTVSAGTGISFTITVTNPSAGIARNVTVTDNLPTTAGLGWTIDPTVSGCSITGSVLTCNFGDIAGGGSKSVTITSPTTAASCGTISNTASVTTTNDGSGESSASVTVNCPNLTVTKTADAATVSAGDAIGFTITVSNTGDGVARNVSLSDTLPTGTDISWSESPDNPDCSITGGVLSCTFGDLAKGDSKSVHVTSPTTKDSCKSYDNTATASADNQPSVTSTQASTEVQCTTITIYKKADTTPVMAGDPLGFTITITNPGPGTAYGVTVTDNLAINPGLDWSIDPAVSGCSITSGVLTCNFGTMAANTTKSVHISSPTTAASCGQVPNAAYFTTTNDGEGHAADVISVLCPDVTVIKTADVTPVSAGDTIGFTITVSNTGQGKAYGVNLSDTLPANTGLNWSIDPAKTECSITSGVLTCDVGTLNPGATFSVHISSPTTPATCGTVDNTATVTATNEPPTGNNSWFRRITVNCPSLTVTKTADADSVNAGDVIGFTITVSNGGPGWARGVHLNDTLPSGSGISWSLAGGTGASYCGIASGVLSCNFGDMAPDVSYNIHVTSPTDATSCGIYNNTATVTSTNQTDLTGTGSTTVNCASIQISKTTTTPTVSAGDPISYTITVSNTGQGTAKNVYVTDTLPNNAGLNWTFVSLVAPNDTNGSCVLSGGPNQSLSCNFDQLAAGKEIVVVITSPTTYASCGTVSNSAAVTTSNDGAATTVPSTITVNCPNLTVTKTADAATVSAGDAIGFTITVTNTGDGVAKNVQLSDTLPSGTGIAWSIASSDPTCTLNGNELSCMFGDLAKGDSRTVHVTSPTTKDSCKTYDNTATASADNQPSVTSTQASTEVQCAAITIYKKADATPVNAGDTVGFTITVTNPGPGTAYGVTVTDNLVTKAGMSWSITPAVPGCSFTGNVLTCNFGTMAAGTTNSVHISSPTTAEACGQIPNTAFFTTTNDGEGHAGDMISVFCPDVTVTKTASSGSVSAGDSISFEITVKNIGAGIARNVSLDDTLPTTPGLSWSLGGTGADDCAIDAGIVTCNFGDMAPDAIKTITLTSPTAAVSCATIDNTASVAATNEPADQTNNSSTASITVLCANISILKRAHPDSGVANAGDTIFFQIDVVNEGQGTAKNVAISDTLPNNPGLHWVLSSLSKPDSSTGSCSVSTGSPQVLTCTFDQLVAHQSIGVSVASVTTLATACATIDNTASVTTSNDGSKEASASMTITCPNVGILKRPRPDSGVVNAGDTIQFQIDVFNTGLSAASNVVITDTLPDNPGLHWILSSLSKPDSSTGSCSISTDSPQVLTCTFDQLAAGGSIGVSVASVTTYATCGIVSNTASYSTGNDGSGTTTPATTITVNCPALEVTKTPDTQTVSAGEPISFTITVNNTGAGTARNVTLSDQLPTDMAWNVDNDDCEVDANGLLTCSFGDLAPATGTSVTVTGDTTPAMCGTFDNTATIKLDNGPDVESNTVSVTVQCPDITVTKEAVSGTINAGDTATFKIVVTNSGAGTAYGVTLTDTLPAGVTWTINPAVAECAITGNTLACAWPSLAAGASVEINVSGATSAALCGKLDNSVTVAASNEAANQTNNAANASITVNCSDVSITKDAASSPINAGDTAAFKIVVTNEGSGTAYNVTLTDNLPAGVAWTINPAVTGCSITGDTLSCSFVSLAAGASIEITVSGTAPAAVCGKLDNTVTMASSNETNSDNNSASASITVNCPDITITKEAVDSPINASDTAPFKIVVTNTGAGKAYNVTLNDTLPDGIAWTIDPAVTGCSITGNTLSCSWATLNAGASITINVSGPAPAAVCGTLDNTATVAASNETNTGNNSASASITVNCAQIGLTKVPDAEFANASDTIGFVITVSNSGAGTAYNVSVTDSLPTNAGMDWAIDPAVPGCSITSDVLTCNFASLASGASISIHVTSPTTPASCGALQNTAVATSGNDGTASASAWLFVNCPDVEVFKLADNSPINAGDVARFTIIVSNANAGTAYNVTLDDTLPASVTWSEDSPYCSITDGVLHCEFGNLPISGYRTIHVSGTTNALTCGVLTNTATVAASNEPDGDQANNSSTATLTVNCPDLSLTKTADAATVSAGTDIGFTITVSNSSALGTGTAYGVTLSDILPSGVTWTISPAVAGCSIASGTLTCSFGDLAPGASVSVHVTAPTSAASCATYPNNATADASNDAPVQASASTTVLCPDVTVSKQAVNNPIHAGDPASFKIVVSNIGAGTAYNVTLTDTLPSGLTWTLSPAISGCSITGGVLSCSWATLASNTSIEIVVTAPTSIALCGKLTNTVTVAAGNEANTNNNSSTAELTINCPQDLQITKTANPTFEREFCWKITKSVDKSFVRQVGGNAIFNYTVTVQETEYCDDDWMVTGQITITNPNDWLDIPITSLTDQVDNGGVCTINNFTPGASVPKGGSLTYDYTCTYASEPNPKAGTNTATATWDASIGTPHGTASGTASFAFDTGSPGNPTNINKTVNVLDTFNGTTTSLGTVTGVTTLPYTKRVFHYQRSVPVPSYGCKTYRNTAEIVETDQTASRTITVCGPMNLGGKTMGFWQNKNGQSIIKNAGSVSGVCKLTPWLRQFAPFQNLSSTASCSTVASYVTNVIKSANASGASMNAILKGQMLATALDVYFSNPALGGNKIGAPAPIGGVTVDLTYIKYSGGYQNVSSAFGGATSMTVMQMLTYASSQSNSGGSVWYGNVKTTQEKAKNAFDAINNNWVFPP